MKAVRILEHGDLDVLRYGDFPEPEVGDLDVLVRVLATSVSGWDLKYRRGELPALPGRRKFPLPMQPGRDAAGVVEAVGAKVRLFRPGDRVVGLVHPANPSSPLTIRGLSNLSTDIEYPGHTMFGGNAQFVARPESYWLKLPENVGYDEAAAALWSYATSNRILNDRLNARLGDTIVVVGASGGMGSATLDLARLMGLRVIAVTRSERSVAFLRELGAAEIVVLPTEDAAQSIRERAGGLGVDGAIDYSGNHAMFRLCLDVLRPGGTVAVLAGEGNRDPLPVTAGDCVRLEVNLHGVRGSTLRDQQTVLALLGQGGIRPRIHSVQPMSEVRAAQAMLAAGGVMGRIILDPWR